MRAVSAHPQHDDAVISAAWGVLIFVSSRGMSLTLNCGGRQVSKLQQPPAASLAATGGCYSA